MKNYPWDSIFTNLYERCLDSYRAGDTDYNKWYDESDHDFLKSIGYQPSEFLITSKTLRFILTQRQAPP